jgi:hypothetical protein
MTVRIWLWVDLHRSRNWPWLHNVSTSDSLAKGEDYRVSTISDAQAQVLNALKVNKPIKNEQMSLL